MKGVLKFTNPDVLILETKQETIDNSLIKVLWSLKEIDWDYIESIGRSGGILTMWDESKIFVSEVIKGRYSLSFKCSTVCKKPYWISNVYGPTQHQERKLVWPEHNSLVTLCLGTC